MLDSYFGQQQYVIYCSQLRATPSADCNISHIAVGLSNYLILIEAFKKLVIFLCTSFANWYYGDWALEVTLPSSSARLDGIYPVQLVHSKEVKFILIYSLGPRFSAHCPC